MQRAEVLQTRKSHRDKISHSVLLDDMPVFPSLYYHKYNDSFKYTASKFSLKNQNFSTHSARFGGAAD